MLYAPGRPCCRLRRLIRKSGGGLQLDFLESRLLMSGQGEPVASYFSVIGTPPTDLTSTDSAVTIASLSVPALSSNPTATAKLYLDFDGDIARFWDGYNVPATPAYDLDGDATMFNASEISSIQEIWERTKEKFSPFKIDVTTIDPGTYANKVALQVVIGGSGSWMNAVYGGISYVGSFYNTNTNRVYVFEDNLGNGNPKYTAEAVCHESGHAFGLMHQSQYDSSGIKINEYNPGNNLIAPVMGNSYYAARGLWANGTTYNATQIQDNLAVLSGTNNGFGYRADDIPSVIPLSVSGANVSGSGIIERMTDVDAFSFTTGDGEVSFTASTAPYGAMLDLKMTLSDSAGNALMVADTSSLGESITTTLTAGSYQVSIASHGDYGDIGQYTITGRIVTPPVFVAAPAGLSATATSANAVNLSWVDYANNESAFEIQRSLDGGSSWITIGTAGSNVMTYSDLTTVAQQTYAYRVRAMGNGSSSAWSNVVVITPVPQSETSLAATAIGNSQIKLTWTDTVGETGYRIERSFDGLLEWSTIGFTDPDVAVFTDMNLNPGSTWYYRVIAIGQGGEAAPGNTAFATTQTLDVPSAPTAVAVMMMNKTKIRVSWSWNGSGVVSGFRIQRSLDGETWTKAATVSANIRAWDQNGMTPGNYYYRVCAYNAAGESPYVAAPMIQVLKPTSATTSVLNSITIYIVRRILGLA